VVYKLDVSSKQLRYSLNCIAGIPDFFPDVFFDSEKIKSPSRMDHGEFVGDGGGQQ